MKTRKNLKIGFGALSVIIIFLFQGCMTYDKDRTGPGSLLLEQNELEQLFSGDVTYHTDLQGTNVAITCFSDGTQELTARDPDDDLEDTGTYTIKDGQKCDQWEKAYGANEICLKFNFVGRGKYYLSNPDGSFHAYMTIE
ncbi:MAG: hypothetical protein ABFS43_09230 [Thermodesulfobacteriota bacterium]